MSTEEHGESIVRLAGSAFGGVLSRRIDHSRQVDPEDRSLAPSVAVDGDVAVRRGHDAVDGRKPETSAFPAVLRREERLEQSRAHFVADAHAGVAHGEHDVIAGGDCTAVGGDAGVDAHVGGLDANVDHPWASRRGR